MTLFERLANKLIERTLLRDPDVIIGGADNVYLNRWHLIPRNPLFNVYLHEFRRSDDDRALHDHPWINLSVIPHGEYSEHRTLAGGIRCIHRRRTGSMALRLPRTAHRIELPTRRHWRTDADGQRHWEPRPIPCWTLFITGPRVRQWGFHCPDAGWRHWRDFTADGGRTIGRGCE